MKDIRHLTKEETLIEEQKVIDQMYHLDKRGFDPRHRELHLKLNAKFAKLESHLKHKEEEE